jgi:hypothetical protein
LTFLLPRATKNFGLCWWRVFNVHSTVYPVFDNSLSNWMSPTTSIFVPAIILSWIGLKFFIN